MRLFEHDNQLLLEPAPLGADELRRNAKFKLRCRRYVTGNGPDGTLVLKNPGNDADFRTLVGRFSAVAEALGYTLDVDPALDARFNALRELA